MTPHTPPVLLAPLRRLLADERRRHASDRELLQSYLHENDADAFAELLRRHGPMVLRTALHLLHHRQDAEDVYQAVFLTLARQAHSLRNESSVAAWLHRVAWRVALRSRAASARRPRSLEGSPSAEASDPAEEISLRESQLLLHQELAALPEQLRLPLVLCYLQGQTRDEAALRLGWSLGTLKRRLERGRKLLHVRLSRRGLSLSAFLATTLLTSAEVSAALAANMLRLAATGGASASVAALLAKGVLSAKLKALGALVLVLAAIAGTGGWVYRGQAGDPATPLQALPANRLRVAPLNMDILHPRLERFGDPLPAGAVARLGTMRLRHGDAIQFVSFAPDGKTIISTGDDGTRVWDAATGRQLRRFGQRVFRPSVALSADGRRLALTARDSRVGGPIELWDVQTGKLLHQLGMDRNFTLVCFAPDGKRIAAFAGRSRPGNAAIPWHIFIWDAATGRLMHKLDGPAECVTSMLFAPDGQSLLLAGSTNFISVRDSTTGKELRQIRDLPSDVHSMILSPQGDRIAFIGLWLPRNKQGLRWGPGKHVILVDLRKGTVLQRWAADVGNGPRPKSPTGLAFSPDGKKLAACSTYGPVQIWNTETGAEIGCFRQGTRLARALAFSPDGRTLAVAQDERVIRLLDAESGAERVKAEGHRGSVTALAIAEDGVTVFAGAADGAIHRWDARTGCELGRLPGHTEEVRALLLSDRGRALWSRSEDRTVRLRKPIAGEGQRIFNDIGGYWLQLVPSPDGALLATSSNFQVLLVIRSTTGEIVHKLPTQRRFIYTAAFTADSSIVAALVGRHTVCRWQTATGRQLPDRPLPADQEEVPMGADSRLSGELFALSPNCRLAAHAFIDKFLRIVDTTTQRVIYRIAKLPSEATAMAFAPDARTFAWGEKSGVIHWLELTTGGERRTLSGHTGGVQQMRFTADGKRLLSGSDDTTALVWDLLANDAAALSDKDRDGCWTDLASADAGRSYRTMCRLMAAPAEALAMLRPRLKPIAAADERHIARCIAELDSETFAVRDKADKELLRLGELAEPDCRKALASHPTLETSRRLRALVDEVSQRQWRPSAETLRQLRAIEALERIGTSEARALLQSLADGAAGARQTREARAALQRLGNPHPSRERGRADY